MSDPADTMLMKEASKETKPVAEPERTRVGKSPSTTKEDDKGLTPTPVLNALRRYPIWASWGNAIGALHALKMGDMETAFALVLSTEDDQLLLKLMDKTGPVMDNLSKEVACKVLHSVGRFLLEQDLLYICLPWIQQLAITIIEHGPDSIPLPVPLKTELLLNLNQASSTMTLPDEWNGAAPETLMKILASSWLINLPVTTDSKAKENEGGCRKERRMLIKYTGSKAQNQSMLGQGGLNSYKQIASQHVI